MAMENVRDASFGWSCFCLSEFLWFVCLDEGGGVLVVGLSILLSYLWKTCIESAWSWFGIASFDFVWFAFVCSGADFDVILFYFVWFGYVLVFGFWFLVLGFWVLCFGSNSVVVLPSS